MKSQKFLLLILSVLSICFACKKENDDKSERFKLLTGHLWLTDSLLVAGQDASGPGQLLEKFAGEADFREDGTGDFGDYSGTWFFSNNENDITISSDSLLLPLTARIRELTAISFKITTSFPNQADPNNPLDIRITFKPK